MGKTGEEDGQQPPGIVFRISRNNVDNGDENNSITYEYVYL